MVTPGFSAENPQEGLHLLPRVHVRSGHFVVGLAVVQDDGLVWRDDGGHLYWHLPRRPSERAGAASRFRACRTVPHEEEGMAAEGVVDDCDGVGVF